MDKIYLISYYFAPLGRADGVNRTYLVKFLAESGWQVEVISCQNPHAFMRNFQKDWSLMEVIPPEVKLHPIKSVYWGPLGGIAALLGLTDDAFGNWIQPVLKMADSIVQEPGIIYAVIPPIVNAKIAYQIAVKYNLPLVLDFRDDVYNLPRHLVQSAITIVASTQASLQFMQEYYGLDADMGITVYNGYPIEQPPQENQGKVASEKLHIVYAGLLNWDQDPALLARAIQYMENKYPDTRLAVTVDFYGPSNYYTRFFLSRYLSENIRFKGYVPFRTVLQEISQADLAYSSLRNERKSYCIPSKIFQYISMETPILAVGPDGALKQLVTETGIGRFSVTKDIASQAEDILYYLREPGACRQAIDNIRRIKPQFATHYQVELLSKHLKKIDKV